MRVTLAENIRILRTDLAPEIVAAIEVQLTIPNPVKELAQRELLWGADRMDDNLRLYGYDEEGNLVLPIGFKHALFAGLGHYGITPELVDERVYVPFGQLGWDKLPTPIELRGYQEPMCQALIDGVCGVVEAPTAAGKTAVLLEAIRRSSQNALIIVEKASLAQQWLEAVQEFLGVDAGYLGESSVRMSPITIALRQALWARREDLWRQGFFGYWGAVAIDECHHAATAQSLIDLVQRFSSRYRWGVTATPDRDPGYFPILQAIVGPVLWETTMADAGDHLVIPRVRVLETEFDFDFHPTGWAVNEETGHRRRVRNNYTQMIAELCKDPARNLVIADEAAKEAQDGHHVLIVSRRVEHLKEIRRLLEGVAPLYMLVGGRGKVPANHDSLEVARSIAAAPTGTILLSTVAEEGLNIPRLDRVIMPFPIRNVETARQVVGRVMRPAPGKVDAVVIDIRDKEQDLLNSQFRDRAQLLYNREEWRIERA